MGKESAAKKLLYFGAFVLAGAIIQGELLASPYTTATIILMMVPYPYIQFRKGMRQGKDSPDPT